MTFLYIPLGMEKCTRERVQVMFNMQSFNGHLHSFDSSLTARLRQILQVNLALGEQDYLAFIKATLRHEMADMYGAWLTQMGLPLKEADRYAHDITLASGMLLQNGVCVAKIGDSYKYVTQSSSFVIALTGTQAPHRKDAIRQDLLPSMQDIRTGQTPAVVLVKRDGRMYVEEIIQLSGQSLSGVAPYLYFLQYAKSLADTLFSRTLAVLYRQDGNQLKTDTGLPPQLVRQYYKVPTVDEARKVILKQLTDSATLGMLPAFDMGKGKGKKLRPIPVLSITKLIPSDW